MDKKLKQELNSALEEEFSQPVLDGEARDRVYANVMKHAQEEPAGEPPPVREKPFPRKKLAIGLGIAACAVLGVFVLFLALPDMPMAQAFREGSRQALNKLVHTEEVDENGTFIRRYESLDDMLADVDMDLPVPEWLPDGFVVQEIEVVFTSKKQFSLAYYYFVNQGDYEDILSIDINYQPLINRNETMTAMGGEFEIIDINGNDVAISEQELSTLAVFFHNDSIVVNINTNLDVETVKEIIAGMK